MNEQRNEWLLTGAAIIPSSESQSDTVGSECEFA